MDFVEEGELPEENPCDVLIENPTVLDNVIDALESVGADLSDVSEMRVVVKNAFEDMGADFNRVTVDFTRGGSSRYGVCSYDRKTRTARIGLNAKVWPLLTVQQRLETLLHETAHAVDFLRRGRSDHGPEWKKIASHLGHHAQRISPDQEKHAKLRGIAGEKRVVRTSSNKSEWRIGDKVRFMTPRGELTARIVRLNERTAGVDNRWRVPYGLLQRVR